MILDALANLDRYRSLDSAFPAAVDFLQSADLTAYPLGKTLIHDKDLYLQVAHEVGRKRDACMLEAHERYADIQIVLAGCDTIGWKPVTDCVIPDAPYDADRDMIFYRDAADAWCAVRPRQCALFFPEDAHQPMVSDDPIHKIVVKIRLLDL